MSNPKRQHYIPKMLLKHFVDDKGILHFFDKDSPEKGVRGQTPKTLFYRSHLYTFTNLDGSRDYSTEVFFSKLEQEAEPIVCKIVDNARMGKSPNLTRSEKDVWVRFFIQLWKRLPAVGERSIANQLDSESDQNSYRVIEGIAGSDPVDRNKMRKFIREEIWPRGIQEEDELMKDVIRPILKNMSLLVAVSSPEQSGFVVGSKLILRIPGHFRLDDPHTELFLPLAYDVALSFVHDQREMLVDLEAKHIRDFNLAIFEQSTLIAGRSRELIESFAVEVS